MTKFFEIRQTARAEYLEEIIGVLSRHQKKSLKQTWTVEELILLLDTLDEQITKQEKT